MIIRENFALQPMVQNYTVPTGTGPHDWGVDIDPEYWKDFKDGNCVLSLWINPNKAFNKKIILGVFMRAAPWYNMGWIEYPANSVKPMKFEIKWDTSEISSDYKAHQFFIRFNKEEHGGIVFSMMEDKMEIGDDSTPYIPNKNDVKAENQAIFSIGGVRSKRFIQSSIYPKQSSFRKEVAA